MMARELSRCEDGFYPGCCPLAKCKHYDGEGVGKAPSTPTFVPCKACHEVVRVDVAFMHADGCWRCHGCYHCDHCKTAKRRKASRYCKECFERLTAPKPCVLCGEPIECKRPLKRWVTTFIKQTKHHKCAVGDCKSKMAFAPRGKQ